MDFSWLITFQSNLKNSCEFLRPVLKPWVVNEPRITSGRWQHQLKACGVSEKL